MAIDTSNLGMGGNPFLSKPGQTNPYLQDIIDLSSRDLVNNFNATTQPAFNAAMVRSGSFGNSGIDAANARAASGLQTNLGDLSSKLRFNDYTQQQDMYKWQKGFDENGRQFDLGFDRATYNDAFGQNQQNLQTGLGLLGLLSGANDSDLAAGGAIRDTPLNYLTQFGNLGSTIGRGGQTQQTTQTGTSSPITGALGGAQLGRTLGGLFGGGNTWQGINNSAASNGYGNTFQQNGYSPNVSYG
ncbi:hypothetical protein [Variovorax sp. DAIF25]|uniref:hypothetical protein n=1 Tax=Variovorax sp. DAIF25 TaxID=3080983 RepID=UPI003D6A8629